MTIYSDSLFLICLDNDEVVFSKNADKKKHPASLTKVVTAAVVLDNCDNVEQIITVPEECITELSGTGSSLGGLKAGEEISVYNLLCCLLLQSANEAATTLADFITNGDRNAFIDKMNNLAKDLGCSNSHFVNPHGLDDDDQYISAEDMAKLFAYAYSKPVFAEICGMSSYRIPETNMHKEHTITSTNYTLSSGYREYYSKYLKGGKTGSTSVAGHCLVSAASYGGYNYVSVALDAPKEDFDNDGWDENGAFLDTKAIVDYAFSNFELVAVADPDRIVAQLPVKFAKGTDVVPLCSTEKVFRLLPNDTDISSLLVKIVSGSEPKHIIAPIKAGEVICKAEVYYADSVRAEIDLMAASDIKTGPLTVILSVLSFIFDSSLFRLLFAIVIIAIISVLLFFIFTKKKKKTGKKYKIYNYTDFVNKKR
ncbi:MAG: D-alanyl-D-alanine carboxypeptidase [Clostridiales bacterium]|nr:D-alanyl-D-alanine carboxypeptidase [Clostridiales bacterium]